MSSRIVLVHPPQAKACEPPPGLLVLAGYLRKKMGATVRVVDANLLVQHVLLSSTVLGKAAEELAETKGSGPDVTSARRAARRAPAAAERLRRPDTYASPEAYRSALDAVVEAYRSVSRARGVRISVSDLKHPSLSPLSTDHLLSVARTPELLCLTDELQAAVEAILAGDPHTVGISTTYLSQALASFALAGLLRRSGFGGRLILGGGLMISWARQLRTKAELFQIWDAVVIGPGEANLAHLAQVGELASTSGLLTRDLRDFGPTELGKPPPVWFQPEVEGLPWDRYLSPGPILPLAASRGCYWRRCAFCPEAAQDHQPFQPAPPGVVRESILKARDVLGARWVHFTDNAVTPAALRRLAKGLRGDGVRWYGFARLEPELLDPGWAEDLALGGCAMLQIGVETASQRLLDLMGKGSRAHHAGPILDNLARAGIRTYVYLLFGIPTETEAETRSTLEWTLEHAPSITFLNLALMSLPRGSALESAPHRYGLRDFASDDATRDLSLYGGMDSVDPLNRRGARATLARARAHPVLQQILRRTPPGFGSNHAAFAPIGAGT